MPLWSILEDSQDAIALLAFADSYEETCPTLAVLAQNRASLILRSHDGKSPRQEEKKDAEPDFVADGQHGSPLGDEIIEEPHTSLSESENDILSIRPDLTPVDIAINQTELDHIRTVLAQYTRNNRRIEPRLRTDANILDSEERKALALFKVQELENTLASAQPDILSLDVVAALLSWPLEPKTDVAQNRVESVLTRDWVSYHLLSRCGLSTVALSVTPPTTSVLPKLELSAERSLTDAPLARGSILWSLATPHQFDAGELKVRIDEEIFTVFGANNRKTEVRIEPSLLDREGSFIRAMLRGRTLEIEGVDLLTQQSKVIRYSLMGFTAALKRVAEICNRPDIIP